MLRQRLTTHDITTSYQIGESIKVLGSELFFYATFGFVITLTFLLIELKRSEGIINHMRIASGITDRDLTLVIYSCLAIYFLWLVHRFFKKEEHAIRIHELARALNEKTEIFDLSDFVSQSLAVQEENAQARLIELAKLTRECELRIADPNDLSRKKNKELFEKAFHALRSAGLVRDKGPDTYARYFKEAERILDSNLVVH